MTHILVIGGSDAGISAALRAREVDPAPTVTMLVADAFPNYSICGLPFYFSGEVSDWRRLAHRTMDEIEAAGIRVRLHTRALAINPPSHTVRVQPAEHPPKALAYDRLVIGIGAGYIGLEMADALHQRGLAVTVAEQASAVLPPQIRPWDCAWGTISPLAASPSGPAYGLNALPRQGPNCA